MLRQLQDHTILTAIAAGDERAFGSLFHEYHQPLGAFVFSVTRSSELTQEIIQDVFVKVWENRKALPAIHNFSAYLFITTRNHTLNTIRKQQLVQKKQQAISSHLAVEAISKPAREENYYDLLDTAVEQLPMQQKKVYLLKQQGLKNTDVALQLNISVNSVKKYQQWALQAISRILKAGPFSGLFIFLSQLF